MAAKKDPSVDSVSSYETERFKLQMKFEQGEITEAAFKAALEPLWAEHLTGGAAEAPLVTNDTEDSDE